MYNIPEVTDVVDNVYVTLCSKDAKREKMAVTGMPICRPARLFHALRAVLRLICALINYNFNL